MPFIKGALGKIHYTLYPKENAPLLVLLNGIMMSSDSWAPFIEPLTENVALLTLDFYDQGQSEHLSTPYTQAIQVELLATLFEALKISSAHIAGISYGASVAFQFAAKHPEKVSSLMIFNGVMKTHEALLKIGKTWNQAAQLENGRAYYEATIPMIYSAYFKTYNADWMEKRKTVLIDVFSNPLFLKRMVRLTDSANTHDVSAALTSFKMPVLIVASDDDPLTPKEEQEKIAALIPHAELVTFYQTGHASMYERPVLFMTTLLGFLLSHSHAFKI